MCYSFNIKGLEFNDYKERKELIDSIDRLETWLFDEITIFQKNRPLLLKQIKKVENKLSLNI